MVKAAKRSSVGAAAFPIAVIPRKTDHQLQSLLNYGDNLEEFVAICAHLPTELKDDLKKVAELSEETHRLTAELSRDQVEILERAKEKYRQMSKPEQVKNLIDEDALQRAREKRKRVDHGVTEKVSITKKMYGALDTCIKNIDEEIAMLEKDVKDSYGVVPDIPTLLSAEAKKSDEDAAAGTQAVAGQAVYPGATAAYGAGAIGAGALGAAAGGGAKRGELTGTNEPVYCVCRQVGWGDMIGCDNEDCEHGEWFHYHCVGLQQVDEQQQQFWLCPGCSLDKREREKKEELEQKAASRNTTPVKLAADAVKLPDEGEEEEEEEEEEEDNDEEGSEAKAGGDGKQGNPGAPKEGGESKIVRVAGKGGESDAPANDKDGANTSKADSPSWNGNTPDQHGLEEGKQGSSGNAVANT